MRPSSPFAATLAVVAFACGGSAPTAPGGATPTPTPGPGSGGTCSAPPVSGVPALQALRVASGLQSPVDLQAIAGDRSRLFVVEQPGRIRLIRDGVLQASAALDITDRVGSGGERGLLGLAFHPGAAQNGRLFVNYTDRGGDTRLAEFRLAGDRIDPASERTLLVVEQPFANHNGGALAFGRDGFLHVALGDGGSGGDPRGFAQNLESLLGKILRLDVDGPAPYAVPSSNPFVSRAGARPEIWAFGLRNPWRISIDRATGDLWIGDVGQGSREEVNVGFASRGGGENYGWNVTEGTLCFNPASGCNTAGVTMPVLEYATRSEGCAITGGFVYRGCRMPALQGHYFYADYCSAFVRSFRLENGVAIERRDWTAQLRGLSSPTSFGVDDEGELHVVDHDGEVYKLVPAS